MFANLDLLSYYSFYFSFIFYCSFVLLFFLVTTILVNKDE